MQRKVATPFQRVGCLLVCLAAGSVAAPPFTGARAATTTSPPAPATEPRQPRSLDTAIRLAGDYLAGAGDERGRFEYRVNLDPRVKVRPRYNELRHAGAIYALAMRHRWEPHEPTRAAMLRAAAHLTGELVRPVSGPDEAGEMLAVWSPETDAEDDHEVSRGQPFEAKLGGAGLALVALASVERASPGTIPVEDLRRLGRFVLYLQKPDGSFHSKFVPSRGGRDDTWTSLFYPGEAALGLLMLHRLDPAPAWVQGASDAIGFLARSRRERAEVPADHWALLATAELLPVLDQCDRPMDRALAIDHALQVCRSILDDVPRHDADPHLAGCFTEDGRTTPTATRLEGLLAALTFLPPEQFVLREEIRAAVDAGVDFLMRAQVVEGPYAGGMPAAFARLAKRHPRYSAAFNRTATEVRIDYVQHALSALVQYDALMKHP
jgi:hypothetical protein